MGFPVWLSGKESTCQCRKYWFCPWFGSIPWRRKCNPLQYCCLENPMDRGFWWAKSMGSQSVGHSLVTKTTNPVSMLEIIIKISAFIAINKFLPCTSWENLHTLFPCMYIKYHGFYWRCLFRCFSFRSPSGTWKKEPENLCSVDFKWVTQFISC